MRFTIVWLICMILSTQIYALDRAIYNKRYSNENKIALVLGNSDYSHFSKLKNTLNDARDMRDILTKQGFDVLYLENGTLREMKKKVRAFAQKLKSGGVGLFYYTGHGMEVEGKNYLIPIGAQLPAKDEVEYESLAVNMLIDKMKNSHNRLNIVVLDACRVNPFDRGGGGLAQINNAKGMYIAFATAPGEVASDGSGRNGLFTKHLIKAIQKPNLDLEEVFKQTRIGVYNESNEKQSPWSSSNIMGDFYFLLSQNSEPQANPNITTIGNLMWEGDNNHKPIKKQWITQVNYDAQKYMDTSGDTANSYCSNLSLGGYNDWRLPTLDELKNVVSECGGINTGFDDKDWDAIIDKNEANKSYESCYKSKGFNNDYWSSTINVSSNSGAWSVDFYNGSKYYSSKYFRYYVRCVRAGQ